LFSAGRQTLYTRNPKLFVQTLCRPNFFKDSDTAAKIYRNIFLYFDRLSLYSLPKRCYLGLLKEDPGSLATTRSG